MPRKRHTSACDLCRSRKVRCDAVHVGVPCSNCSKHKSKCVVSLAHSARQQPQHVIPLGRTHRFRVKARHNHVGENSINTSTPLPSPLPDPTTEDHEYGIFEIETNIGDQGQPHLPAYITPLSKAIHRENLQVLVQRDALAFPPPDIIDEIIRSFLCYVYPLLPIIRLDDFLAAMGLEPGKTISPLLFQAVLLAGAVFTDFSHSQHPSFQRSKDVQKLLFGRVKLLYDMEVESNPVIVIQSLLLMTYWHSQLNDIQGRLHWLRIALSLATEIGLHNPDLHYEELEENNFRRQLWSCCIIRSALICIGERGHVLLPCPVLGPPILSPEHWSSTSLFRALDLYSVSHTGEQMEILGRILIQKVELCRIILHTLDTLYELSGLRRDASSHSIMVLIPKTKGVGSLVIALDEKLREWHDNASQLGLFNRQQGDLGSAVPVHSAILEMLYHTALSTVHRPLMLHHRQLETATGAMRAFSSATLRSSACRITDIGRELDADKRISCLPPVATAMFISATAQHLKDAMSPNMEYRQSGSLYLGHVLRIFRLLNDRYNHVHSAIDFISRVENGEHFDHSLEWEDRVSSTSGKQPNYETPTSQ
ncbi:hypothetical protein B0A52_07477 [Exophiala mesophila]|uniref:Zn(2)-C6 fungal-type domain-containing protein n=1 Tax=Exophiala mesophila TaxID=212818 RepID=A0A438MYK7_EXOME|nr:hypothetical protein B0A52_07477 [Exophiala mesophila]